MSREEHKELEAKDIVRNDFSKVVLYDHLTNDAVTTTRTAATRRRKAEISAILRTRG
jgi:hypothetical protein